MNKKYNQSQPIILGLAGKAGSGKTSVAEAICPKGSIKNESSGIIWEHIFHALPLYDFASTKKNIKGFHNFFGIFLSTIKYFFAGCSSSNSSIDWRSKDFFEKFGFSNLNSGDLV